MSGMDDTDIVAWIGGPECGALFRADPSITHVIYPQEVNGETLTWVVPIRGHRAHWVDRELMTEPIDLVEDADSM